MNPSLVRIRPLVLAMFLSALPGLALGQGAARSLDIDPSVRAAAMGGASNAVFWGGANQWGNPALLGYHRGIRWEWGDTQLVPELASDVHFATNVAKLGGGGFSVALSGKPVAGLGGLKLDYGESEGVDDQGNSTGTFTSFEDIDSWGFGVSLAQAGEGIARLFGHQPPLWSRLGDLSFGMNAKEVEIQLAPDPTGRAHATARDVGFLLRVSPLEWLEAIRDQVDLDLAYGWSELSSSAPEVNFQGSAPSRASEHARRGFAIRGALEMPRAWSFFADRRWWLEGLNPLVSVAYAQDHAEISSGTSASRYETDGSGYEVGIANLFWYRSGSYEDRVGSIDGGTSGWGVGLPIGKLGGFRYDRANFPQPMGTGLGDLDRKALSAWVDPLEIWTFMKR